MFIVLLLLLSLAHAIARMPIPQRIKDSNDCVRRQLQEEARNVSWKIKASPWKPRYLNWKQAWVGPNITLAVAKLWEVLWTDNDHSDVLFLTHQSPFWDNFQQYIWDPMFKNYFVNPNWNQCERFNKELTMKAFWVVNYDIKEKPKPARDYQYILWHSGGDEDPLQCDEFLDPEENTKRWGSRAFLQAIENQLRVGQQFKMWTPGNQWRVEVVDQPLVPYSPKYPQRWVMFTLTFQKFWYDLSEQAWGGPLPL